MAIYDPQPKSMSQFVKFVTGMGIDPNNENQVDELARQYFGNSERTLDTVKENLYRHTVAIGAPTGLIYKDGPFTWMTDELISDVTFGGSALMQWIPMETMGPYREETVSHLSWVAPNGWQPKEESYREYLDGERFDNQDECDQACIKGDWAAFEYNVKYGDVCTSSGKLTIDEFGMRQHQKVAIPRVRGGMAGMNMATDADWARARAAIVMEMHLDWNLLFGSWGGAHQWDGLYEMLTPGYVDSHLVGGGAPHWANPYVFDGTVVTTCDDLAILIKNVVRLIRKRIRQHNYRVGMTDMAVVMPSAFWARLMDCVACGGMTGCGTAPTGYTIADWRAERERLATGGVGYGILEVDGTPIPVIPQEGIAVGSLDADGNNIITGDILVLTRRMNGMNIIAQEMFDWNQIDGFLEATYNSMIEQGGIFKTSWISENDLCFEYRLSGRGRNIIRHFPLQARIASVSLPVELPYAAELETAFLNEYFYGAYDVDELTPIP